MIAPAFSEASLVLRVLLDCIVLLVFAVICVSLSLRLKSESEGLLVISDISDAFTLSA